MRLTLLVEQYSASLPAGIVLDEGQVLRNLRRAVRLYCGYATLIASPSEAELYALSFIEQDLPVPLVLVGDVHSPVDEVDAHPLPEGQDFDLTPSELAIIGPLWRLYNERENADSLEASRALGLDVYGRATSEIEQDIRERESMMPNICFYEPVVSI